MDKRVAIVTGGNRGIGLEICRQLAEAADVHVILTARSETRGREAAELLQAEGLDVSFHQLDVNDAGSVRRLVKHVADHYRRADILINNAAISIDPVSLLTVDLSLVRQTMETNFFGPLRLCQMFVPLMRRHNYGRIVNVSSGAGSLELMGKEMVGYRASKAALNALTRVLANELEGSNILVNSADPGWVRTELGGPEAPRRVEEGAPVIVWLATLPDDGPTGGFFKDRKPVPW